MEELVRVTTEPVPSVSPKEANTPGNYFTIPETIKKGLRFIEELHGSTKDYLNSRIPGISPRSSPELYASLLCLNVISDLERVSSTSVLYTLKQGIRFILRLAPFHIREIQNILTEDVNKAAVVTWVLLQEGLLSRNGAVGLGVQVLAAVTAAGPSTLDPITAANVMRLLYQTGLESELTEVHLLSTLNTLGTCEFRNDKSPDAFLYFLATTIVESPRAKQRFQGPVLEALEARIGESTNHPLDIAMRILSYEALGLLDSAKVRNRLSREFTSLKDLQGPDGSWPKDTFWGKGLNELYSGGRVVSTAFALKAIYVFYDRRKKSLIGTRKLSPHIIT